MREAPSLEQHLNVTLNALKCNPELRSPGPAVCVGRGRAGSAGGRLGGGLAGREGGWHGGMEIWKNVDGGEDEREEDDGRQRSEAEPARKMVLIWQGTGPAHVKLN